MGAPALPGRSRPRPRLGPEGIVLKVLNICFLVVNSFFAIRLYDRNDSDSHLDMSDLWSQAWLTGSA